MAVATVGVGLVPSNAYIGMAAPLILMGLRLLQGFAVGGEWAGTALLSAEYAPGGRRGRYDMFTLLGGEVAGVRRMMLIGWSACVPWTFVVIPLLDTGKPVMYAVAVVGMFAVAGIGSGPTGAFIPELFATRYRFSGSALAINLSGVVGGALPPLLAGTLLATYGSWSIGVMLAALTLTGVICTYLLPETHGTTL